MTHLHVQDFLYCALGHYMTVFTLTTTTTLELSQFMFQEMEINLTCTSADEVSLWIFLLKALANRLFCYLNVELHSMHCYNWTGPLICSFKYHKKDIQGKSIIIENV